MAVISGLLALVGPFLTGQIVNLFADGGEIPLSYAFWLCALSSSLLMMRALLTYRSEMLYVELQSHAGFKLNAETLEHIKHLPQTYFKGFDSAYLTQQVNHDSNDLVIFVINSVVQTSSSALMLLATFIVLAGLNYKLCFICFVLAILSAGFYLISRNKLFQKSFDVQEQVSKFFSALQEQLDMAMFIRRHALFDQFGLRLNRSFDELFPALRENQATASRFTLGNALVAAAAQGCLLAVGVIEVTNGRLLPGYLVTAIGYYSTLDSSIQYFLAWGKEYQSNRVCYERLRMIWDLPEEENGALDIDPLERILLQDLRFRYPNAEHDSLKLNGYEFKRGHLYGVAGVNGSGKSSLLTVLLGLYPAETKGLVQYNESSLCEIDRYALRRERVGITEQEPPLAHASLLDNLTMFRSVKNQDELNRLIDSLGLRGLVSRSPYGLDTIVGDGKEELSGGEKQKIAIIRQLLNGPDVMLFDEPTSALDSESRKSLISLLREKKTNHIIIVVTHDQEMLDACDEIIEMEVPAVEVDA